LKDILNSHDWWKQLEPQWQQAFGISVLRHSNLPDEAELEKLYNIQTIRLAGPTAPFPNLSFELTNLSGVEHLANLEILIVTHHKIKKTEELRNLARLRSLYLFNNAIVSLKGIESLTLLEQLYVQCNQITSINAVERLINLKEFYINDNRIATLDGLTESHSEKLLKFICRPNELLKQKEIIRAERELGIICKG
jgi:Leucine-rich repeat (LRR) protein